jgi:hypothetical protein
MCFYHRQTAADEVHASGRLAEAERARLEQMNKNLKLEVGAWVQVRGVRTGIVFGTKPEDIHMGCVEGQEGEPQRGAICLCGSARASLWT